jgi:hypothetical protein
MSTLFVLALSVAGVSGHSGQDAFESVQRLSNIDPIFTDP